MYSQNSNVKTTHQPLLKCLPRTPELMTAVRNLSEVSAWRTIAVIANQWFVIGLAVACTLWLPHWGVYLLAGCVIATRQQALGILMHDATHGRLFKSSKLGDFVCDIFCAFPIGMTTDLYRREHQQHHFHLNTNADPYWASMSQDQEWSWPKTPIETLRIFFLDLIGIHANRMLKWSKPWSPYPNFMVKKESLFYFDRNVKFRFVLFLIVLGSFLTLTNGWLLYLLLWVIPAITWTTLIVRIRSSAEHLALPNENELNSSRHVEGTFLERILFCPLNINYHIDHHLFPSVPYFNLPKLHARLMKEPIYKNKAHIHSTYTSLKDGVFAELIKPNTKTKPHYQVESTVLFNSNS